MAKCLLLLIIAPFVVAAEAPQWEPPHVKLKAGAIYRSAKDVLVQVTVDNSYEGCHAVLVNQAFFATRSEEPITLLSFIVTDSSGREVARIESGGTRARVVPTDLMTLHCGMQYGWYVSLSKLDWAHALGVGRYRLRARIENSVRQYFEKRPKELAKRAALSGGSEDDVRQLLRDFTAVSDEVTFEIEK